MGHRLWPLFDLVVRTPRLELRYPDDALLEELAEVATGEIHPPETMPFGFPWTDVSPDERGRSTLVHQWKTRAEWAPSAWHCGFATVVDGKVVGSQGMHSSAFAVTRTVTTGSWIAMPHQGQGIGKEMRAAVVHLAFAGLGATRCESAGFEDNPASLGVSRALGYVENGDEIHTRRDGAGRIIRLLLTQEAWESRRRNDITIEGLGPCMELFGASAT
ncbi:MAG: GNAT family N-acetyltransferase [Acidimicrobiales bacterium]